jgi:hypothetical protein
MTYYTQFILNFYRLVLLPKICSILEKVPWASGKNVFSVAVYWIFCRYLINPFHLCYILTRKFQFWFFFLDKLSIGMGLTQNYHTWTNLSFYSACVFSIIVLPSWWIVTCINTYWPSITLLMNLVLNSIFFWYE